MSIIPSISWRLLLYVCDHKIMILDWILSFDLWLSSEIGLGLIRFHLRWLRFRGILNIEYIWWRFKTELNWWSFSSLPHRRVLLCWHLGRWHVVINDDHNNCTGRSTTDGRWWVPIHCTFSCELWSMGGMVSRRSSFIEGRHNHHHRRWRRSLTLGANRESKPKITHDLILIIIIIVEMRRRVVVGRPQIPVEIFRMMIIVPPRHHRWRYIFYGSINFWVRGEFHEYCTVCGMKLAPNWSICKRQSGTRVVWWRLGLVNRRRRRVALSACRPTEGIWKCACDLYTSGIMITAI